MKTNTVADSLSAVASLLLEREKLKTTPSNNLASWRQAIAVLAEAVEFADDYCYTAAGRQESLDRGIRRARKLYFDTNPPNTWLAEVFNELLKLNGTFEQDPVANAKREQNANGG